MLRGVGFPLLSVYPAGFEIELLVRFRTDQGDRVAWAVEPSLPRPPWSTMEQIFRFAVVYADGRTVTNLEENPGRNEPGVTMTRSVDTRRRSSSMRCYVQPLPPPGSLTFICEWPAYGVPETRAEIDARQIIHASAGAVPHWPEPGGDTASWRSETAG